MNLLDSDLIQPLHLAENDLLQVLLSKFSLARNGAGAQLEVRFDEQTPTIWSRKAKSYLHENMKDFNRKARRYQKELDAFLVQKKQSSYKFEDDRFLFRYGSGGTLPVIRMGKDEYYCLIYRDVYPIGWNIANGGCDSRNELLNPLETMERELREELIIIDPINKRHYVFEANEGGRLDHPDFATAWQLWQPRFRELNFPSFEEWQIPLKWLEGPDTLKVQFGGDDPVIIKGCCLNINAEDFGIEIDQVAKVNVDENVVLCDGEILRQKTQQLLNRPVALFEVERFNSVLADGAREFIPDHVFYSTGRYNSGALSKLAKTLLQVRAKKERRQYEATEYKFDLCPVTRRIIQRYLDFETGGRKKTHKITGGEYIPYDVFVSFASEDRKLAKKVYEYLQKKAGKRVFFSDETQHQAEFGREIDDALDSATCLIAVGSSVDHLMKRWVDYEWRSFHEDILSGKKPKEAQLLSFISGISPLDLPSPLRHRKAIVFESPHLEAKLRELAKCIP